MDSAPQHTPLPSGLLSAAIQDGVEASRPASRAASLPILKPLTSLRFLAALAVFFSHLGYLRNLDSCKWLCARIFVEGYAGVTFFFVLSGFILAYNYHRVLTSLRFDEIKKFYVARFARIYPIYILTFLISLPLVRDELVQQPLTSLRNAILQVFALQSFVPERPVYFAFNSPAWSLSDEFFFYALLPLIIFALARWNVASKKSLAALALGTWLVALGLVTLGRDQPLAHWLFYIVPPFRLFDFVLGVACGLFFLKGPVIKFGSNVWTLLELACLGGILALVFFSPYVHQSFRYGVYYMPIFCLTIFVFAHQGGWVSKVLSTNGWVLLGEISFAFYMFHQLVFRYLNELSRGHFGYSSHPFFATFVALAITLALSYLSFRYYEKFTRDKIKQAFKA